MKHLYIFLVGLLAVSFSGEAQIKVGVFYKGGVPQNGFFNGSRNITIVEDDGSKNTYKEKEVFRKLAGYGTGYGLEANYDKNAWLSGVSVSWMTYAKKIEAYRLKSFHVTTYLDYQWPLGNNAKFYLGVETGIYTTKAIFNKDLVLAENLSQSRFGIGARSAVSYDIGKVQLKLRGKEVINRNFPFFEWSIGMNYNLGDF